METVTLKFNVGAPRTPNRGPWDIWVEELERRSNESVNVDIYFYRELSPPNKVYESVINGTADVGLQYIMMEPSRYAGLEVMNVARPDTVCTRPSRVALELYQKIPEIQSYFSDSKLLACGATSPVPYGNSLLGTAKKPVHSLKDLQGMKINAAGKYAPRLLKDLGAVPMELFPPDMLDNLQNGVLDGGLIDALWLDVTNLREGIGYLTQVNFGFIPYFITMNRDTWNQLPQKIKKIVEEISGEYYADRHDQFIGMRAKEAVELSIRENGVKLIALSKEEMAEWANVFNRVRQEFAADMDTRGINGKDLLECTDRLYAKYAESG